MAEGAAADPQRMRDVRKVGDGRAACAASARKCASCARLLERLGRARRNAAGTALRGSTAQQRPERRLFEHDVRVRAAEPERADAARRGRRAARPAVSAVCTWNGVRRSRSSGWACRSRSTAAAASRCNASDVLIRPAAPAAITRWPTLLLSEPIAQKPLVRCGGGTRGSGLRSRSDRRAASRCRALPRRKCCAHRCRRRRAPR